MRTPAGGPRSRRGALSLACFAAGISVAAGAAWAHGTANEWAGSWKSTNEPNGRLTLAQSGSSVTGTYLGTNLTVPWKVQCTVKGRECNGSYTYQTGSPPVGQGPFPVRWTMSADLGLISGTRDSGTRFDFQRVGTAPTGTTTTTSAATTGGASLGGAAYGLLKTFMAQYDRTAFGRASDLGALGIYRTTLLGLTIKIDPKQSAIAKYDPTSNSITFSRDPRTAKPGDLAFGETVWHELTHAIEDRHGDIGVFDSKLYAERNTEYMTHVARSALPILERLEKTAREGGSVAKLRQYWSSYLRAMDAANRLPESRKYPPNLTLLRSWFGFRADPAAIRRLYLTGRALPGPAGANLRKALGP